MKNIANWQTVANSMKESLLQYVKGPYRSFSLEKGSFNKHFCSRCNRKKMEETVILQDVSGTVRFQIFFLKDLTEFLLETACIYY